MAESYVACSSAAKVFLVDERQSLADVVHILGTLHDGLKQVFLFEEGISTPLTPYVYEVVLEKFEVPHQ